MVFGYPPAGGFNRAVFEEVSKRFLVTPQLGASTGPFLMGVLKGFLVAPPAGGFNRAVFEGVLKWFLVTPQLGASTGPFLRRFQRGFWFPPSWGLQQGRF